MKLLYPAIFTPFEEGNGFTVEVPDLPGCVSQGDNLIEAIEMGTDAASGWILGELEDGNTYPAPSPASSFKLEDNQFINMLILDIDAYSEKYGTQTVRKNITIPAWLNTYGEMNHINFSKVLSEALMKQASN